MGIVENINMRIVENINMRIVENINMRIVVIKWPDLGQVTGRRQARDIRVL